MTTSKTQNNHNEYKALFERIEKELRNEKKGIFPINLSVRNSIELHTGGKLFNLPQQAAINGYFPSAKDMSNLLHLYFWNTHYPDAEQAPLYSVLSDEGVTVEGFSLWLDLLDIVDLNGVGAPWLFKDHYLNPLLTIKNFTGNPPEHIYEFNLTPKGIEFMNVLKQLYRNYGYTLLLEKHPSLTIR